MPYHFSSGTAAVLGRGHQRLLLPSRDTVCPDLIKSKPFLISDTLYNAACYQPTTVSMNIYHVYQLYETPPTWIFIKYRYTGLNTMGLGHASVDLGSLGRSRGHMHGRMIMWLCVAIMLWLDHRSSYALSRERYWSRIVNWTRTWGS